MGTDHTIAEADLYRKSYKTKSGKSFLKKAKYMDDGSTEMRKINSG